MNEAKLKTLLTTHGYDITELLFAGRVVLVLDNPADGRGPWTGIGPSRASAMDAVLGALLPSALARSAFAALVEPKPTPDVILPGSRDPLRITASPEPEPSAPAAAVVRAIDEAKPAPDLDLRRHPFAAPAAAVVRAIDEAAPVARRHVAPRTSTAAGAEAVASIAAANAKLAELGREIDTDEPAFAIAASPQQRLRLLVWVAQARALEPSGVSINRFVGRLGLLASTYWPGSVRALQMSTEPDGVRLRAGSSPTWEGVAELAKVELAMLRSEAIAAGLSADGWVRDVAAPCGELAALAARTKLMMAPASAPISATELVALAGEVRAHRPLVASDRDRALAWGVAWGLVRRAASSLSVKSPELDRILNEKTSFVQKPAESRADQQRAKVAAISAELEVLAGDLGTWLLAAFDRYDTPELAIALKSRAHEIAELAEPSDRRLKRRFAALCRALRRELESKVEATEAPIDDKDDEAESEPSVPPELAEQWKGRKVLLVSNCEDKKLAADVAEGLAADVVAVDNNVRRVQAACESIRAARYDLVLGLVGFLNHATDTMLREACGVAIPYVRVTGRGRLRAVVAALARTNA